MTEREIREYRAPAYPETYGDIIDWAIRRVEDPENKVFFRLSEGNISVTYADFGRRVDKIANFLRDRGLKKGDHVAIFLPNCLEYAFLYHSLAKCGAVMVPIIKFLRGEPLRYIIDHSDSTYLITSYDLFADKISPHMPSFRRLRGVFFIDNKEDIKGVESVLFSDYEKYPPQFEGVDVVT